MENAKAKKNAEAVVATIAAQMTESAKAEASEVAAAADGEAITKKRAEAVAATVASDAGNTKEKDEEILALIHERKTTKKGRFFFLHECGEVFCDTDPVLKRNVRAYSKFVRKMHGVGLVGYSLHCECELGVFFVHKKSRGRIRLILDCRRANVRFWAPPGTELLSSEGF